MNHCKLDMHSNSTSSHLISSDLQMDLSKTRRALRRQKSNRFATLDNIYPLIILLVYVPEAVLDIEGLSHLHELISILLAIMIALNMIYVGIFVLSHWSLYSDVDKPKDAWSMYFYWHGEREKILKPVIFLMFVVAVDFFLGLGVTIALWVGREHRSTLAECMPTITTTYVWMLTNAIPFVKGWTEFKSCMLSIGRFVWTIVRCRCRSGVNSHELEVGSIESWEKKTVHLIRKEGVEWTHHDHVETGNCIIEYIHLCLNDNLDAGTIKYRAWTRSTWTGDYFHMWPSWITPQQRREYKCKDVHGLLPNDFILHIMREPFDHMDFIVQFKLDTPMSKDDLPDKISLLCAA